MRVAKERSTRSSKRGAGREENAKPDKSYFGPVYPEAPRFGNPEDDLLKIGITRVSRLKRTQLERQDGKWQESRMEIEEW
jgi:hypothetical protein